MTPRRSGDRLGGVRAYNPLLREVKCHAAVAIGVVDAPQRARARYQAVAAPGRAARGMRTGAGAGDGAPQAHQGPGAAREDMRHLSRCISAGWRRAGQLCAIPQCCRKGRANAAARDGGRDKRYGLYYTGPIG